MPPHVAFRLLQCAECALSGFSVQQILMFYSLNHIIHLFSNLQVQLRHTLVLQLGGGIGRCLSQPAYQPGLYIIHADLGPILAGTAYGSLRPAVITATMSPLVTNRLGGGFINSPQRCDITPFVTA